MADDEPEPETPAVVEEVEMSVLDALKDVSTTLIPFTFCFM
jgi:hypothetical protein